MATWHSGRLLVAAPSLEDPNFSRSVVLVLDHDEDGALGIVLNRRSEVPVSQTLEAWAPLTVEPQVIFGGGPVEPTAVVALGRSTIDVAPDGSTPIVGPIRLVNLEEDPREVAGGVDDLRIFAGYAGWGPGQLEAEIATGSWFVVDSEADDVFSADPQSLWRDTLRRQPGRLRLMSTYPPDPGMN